MTKKESYGAEAENNNFEHPSKENEVLDTKASDSDDFVEFSTKERYIQKYGIDPTKTPIFISSSSYQNGKLVII